MNAKVEKKSIWITFEQDLASETMIYENEIIAKRLNLADKDKFINTEYVTHLEDRLKEAEKALEFYALEARFQWGARMSEFLDDKGAKARAYMEKYNVGE